MLKIDRYIAKSGYDRIRCHANPVALPLGDGALMLTQKLLISAIDCFSEVSYFTSSDGGASWGDPEAVPVLPDVTAADGSREGYNTSVLHYCKDDGSVLVMVTTYNYNALNKLDRSLPQQVKYFYFYPEEKRWSTPQLLPLPAPEGAGVLAVNAPLTILDNGDFLLPYSVKNSGFTAKIARIRRSGDGSLSVVDESREFCCDAGRGVLEPSLALFQGKYYLSLRNDESGMVACSEDWHDFPELKKWCFSDGSWLGNCNTMTRLLGIKGKLYLVYTRQGLNNDHVFRNRAPLLIGQVDTATLTVIRASEQVVVPEHGARLGNFTAVSQSENQAYVSVAEWMQTLEPEWFDCKKCEEYGADNRIWYVTLKKDRREI